MLQLLRKLNRPVLSRVSSTPLISLLSDSRTNDYTKWVSGVRSRVVLSRPPMMLGFRDRFDCHVCWLSSGTILVQAPDLGKLGVEIESALDERRFSDSWRLFEQHLCIDGLPRKSVINKVVTTFAESLEVLWLEKAAGLVDRVVEEGKQSLLEKECLIYLCFCLAKCGLPVESSVVLRRLIEMEHYPPAAAWSAILAYMSMTDPGASLAAELVIEICYLFQDGRVDPRKKSNAPLIAMKPNTLAVNIALVGCLSFGLTKKAERILGMIPRVGIKLDENMLIIMAHIHERNGRREELKKLQRHIDESPGLSDVQLQQFYNSLLTCHLKLGDLDSACDMVLKMLQKAKEVRNSLATATFLFQGDSKFPTGQVSLGSLSHGEMGCIGNDLSSGVSMIPYEEFSRDQRFRMLEAEAKELLGSLFAKLQVHVELVTTQLGILQPTDELYVKLVKAFLEAGKTKDLAAFLIKAEKEGSPFSSDDSILVQVINSCISIGWLDQAHDLLDEMRLSGVRVSSSIYVSLLKAYCDLNRAAEAQSLLRDAHRAGVQLDSNSYEALIKSRVLEKDTQGALRLFQEMKQGKIPKGGHPKFDLLVKGCEEGGEARIMSKLLREIKEGQMVDSGLHDWNNIIHFFCKKRLMQDAENALKKMRSLGHSPNAQTFHSMVTGYLAVGGKYVEVTELWGEMKYLASTTSMTLDQELLDCVLYTFVRGGFFVRANEVVDMMEKGNMFVDKFKYRILFLKHHKTLYKGKAPKFQTEGQQKKREAALNFKKWVGLN